MNTPSDDLGQKLFHDFGPASDFYQAQLSPAQRRVTDFTAMQESLADMDRDDLMKERKGLKKLVHDIWEFGGAQLEQVRHSLLNMSKQELDDLADGLERIAKLEQREKRGGKVWIAPKPKSAGEERASEISPAMKLMDEISPAFDRFLLALKEVDGAKLKASNRYLDKDNLEFMARTVLFSIEACAAVEKEIQMRGIHGGEELPAPDAPRPADFSARAPKKNRGRRNDDDDGPSILKFPSRP